MAKENFTGARIAAYRCEPGKRQSFFWDAKVSGLGFRVTASGAKAYIFERRLHGKSVRITIGGPDHWTLDAARDKAAELGVAMDNGDDPREQEQEKRAAAEDKRAARHREQATTAEAWQAYLEHLRTTISPKTKQPRSPRYLADHKALAALGGEPLKRGKGTTVRGPLADLLEMKLSDLSAKAVAAWLENEARERPTNAAHAYRLLKAFIRWTAGQDEYAGVVPDDAYNSPKVTGVLPHSQAEQGDVLQREMLKPWFAAVRGLANKVAGAYLQALLIKGARREEMAALKWTDVDFQWRTMHLADKVDTQTGRVIPLTPYLAAVLAALPSATITYFSNPSAADGNIAEPRFAHNRALAAADLPPLTVHGLRRSFGTLAEWTECPVGVTAQIMGHAPSALAEKHYRRRPLDLLRVWHVKIEKWLLDEANVPFVESKQSTGLRAVQ